MSFWVCFVLLKWTDADEKFSGMETSRPLDTRKEAEKKYRI